MAIQIGKVTFRQPRFVHRPDAAVSAPAGAAASFAGSNVRRVGAAVVVIAVCGSLAPVAAQSTAIPPRQAIVAAEHARAPDGASLEVLLDGLKNSSPAIQQLAVRALGRLERPSLTEQITPMLAASTPLVRAEAANALGQAHQNAGTEGASAAVRALTTRLVLERDAMVRGVIYQTLGRLPHSSPEDVGATEMLLVRGTAEGASDPRGSTRLGAVTGLESLLRQQAKKASPSAATINRLNSLVRATAVRRGAVGASADQGSAAREGGPARDTVAGRETAVRARRLALAALIAGHGVDAATIRAAFSDRDPQVRRLAAVALGAPDALAGPAVRPSASTGPPTAPGDPLRPGERTALLATALRDPQAMVRYQALQAAGASETRLSCAPIIAASRNSQDNAARNARQNPAPRAARPVIPPGGQQVVLLAIDLLSHACAAGEQAEATAQLVTLAEQLPATATAPPAGRVRWHAPAHALVSLAAVAPAEGARLLPRFMSHPTWQVRMYSARAAAILGDDKALATLADDSDDNVRSAAIAAISKRQGHTADAVYIAALTGSNNELIRVAAGALAGTPDQVPAIAALITTLNRLTALKLDNTRDPRVAILQALKNLGTKEQASSLDAYLTDFDPRVATLAAEVLTMWTGTPQAAAPLHPVVPPPDSAAVMKLASSIARMRMAGGGVIDLQLFPEEAPATVERFVRLARAGYYNGLTFHRIVANFVIQGGSPGANEFVGDSPFLNDEVGLRSHIRGAVGISTRGRDTGDAQLFVDLVDNGRLDHLYTIVGQVTRGMEIVDAVLEGDVIERIEIIESAKSRSN